MTTRRKAVRQSAGSKGELLAFQCRCLGLPVPVLEHRFHPVRRWRFDAGFLAEKLAVEIDGGIWIGGRHNTGTGYKADLEKLNEALCMGWRVLRVLPEQVKNGTAVELVARCLSQGAN